MIKKIPARLKYLGFEATPRNYVSKLSILSQITWMHFGLCIYAYCALMALVQSAFSLQRSLIQLSPELLLLS